MEELVEKLTKPQRLMLARAEAGTFADDSGSGYAPYDRTELRVAERLQSAGLVAISMVTGRAPFGFARITEKGRAALASSPPPRGEKK